MRASAVFAVTRAVLSRSVASPLGAFALVGALAAWPVITVASPLGILRDSSTSAEWNYELAFMAGTVGLTLATAARKRLDPLIEIFAERPAPLIDAGIVALCGASFAALALLPAFPFGHASDPDLARLLPLLAVAAAWSALAMRLLAGEAAAWSVAVGAVMLPAIFPTSHLLLRGTAAAAALVLGATLVDHPPARQR